MVGQVGIHDDHKVSRAKIETMYVCGSIRRRAIVKVSGDNRPEYQSGWHTRGQACQRAV